jgi:putative inorganic carbon (hco3(-)) transporter
VMVFVVFSAFRKMGEIRRLVWAWAGCAALSSLWSLVQFERKYAASKAAHENFYASYVGSRITGFMGHWMTFSGHMMMALMLIGALLFFGRVSFFDPTTSSDANTASRGKGSSAWLLAAGAIVMAGLLAAFTRSMWLGALVGGVYLVWMWQRRLVLAIPVLGGILLLANPFALRERAISAFEPHGDMDSNEHRVITRRVGYAMIQAHPWFGVGPEEVGPHFKEYLPADVPLPLPPGYYGHLHNIYIHYAAERGIPTTLALMWMLGQALFDFIRAVARAPKRAQERWALHGSIAVMLAVLVSGFYELNLGDSEVLGMFLAVVACGYCAAQSLKTQESAPISAAWPAKAPKNI